MKIISVMEYLAVLMILVGLLFGMGKATLDHVCSMIPDQVSATAAVFPPSTVDKEIYIASQRRYISEMEAQMIREARR